MRIRVFSLVILFVVAPFNSGASISARAQSLRDWRRMADEMVSKEIVAAGVKNERVVRAMRETPRHEFVPANQRQYAYYDMALPIGEGQTISPPFIVAYMTQEIDPQPGDRVLEIGTGSGYQAAVLSSLVKEVFTIEIVESLGKRAERTLNRLDYQNVHVRVGDGYLGWPEAAPFDKIIVTCSPEKVPQPLVDQLKDGGLMIVPVGERYQQNLYLFRKENGELQSEALRPTLFVPMTGEAEERRAVLPDPKNPQIINGGFEESRAAADAASTTDAVNTNREPVKEPTGWHYQRQLKLVTAASGAPEGNAYAVFRNDEPGRGCQALQGFAIDGREVAVLRLSMAAKGENIRAGQDRSQLAQAVISFYDQRRAVVGEELLGPYLGTFPWRRDERLIRVPLAAREAIIRVGLLGAVGELSVDDVKLSVAAQ